MHRLSIILAVGLLFSFCKKSGSDNGSGTGSGSGGSTPYQTSAQIGAAGGTISDPNGNWTLTIPAGALMQAKTITVTTNAVATGSVPDEFTNTSPTLSFEPHGLTFLSDATLKVKYAQGDMSEGGIEEKMQKQYYINDDSKVTAMTSTVNTATNEITAQIPHFSFSASLTSSIKKVNNGTTTRPSSVRRVANRVIAYFNSLGSDAARNAEFQANAALLNAFIQKLVQILGSDILTAAFPNADFNNNGIPNSSDPLIVVGGASVTLTSSGSLFVSTNAGAIGSTQFIWRSSASGTYAIRLNGTNCTDGTLVQGGAVTLNVDNTVSGINASALLAGDNEYRICVTVGATTTFLIVVIARDEVYPVSSASPGGGTYTTAQNVSMSCLDTGDADCAQIAYTTNGTDPTFDAAGNVTNGTLVTGMWLLPYGGPTTLKIVSRDEAGNIGPAASYTFTGPAQTPPVTSASPNGGVFTTAQNVTLSCSDTDSGCRRIVYTTDGSIPSFSPVNGTIVTGSSVASIPIGIGATWLLFAAEDLAGNIEPYRQVGFVVSGGGFTYVATAGGLSIGSGQVPSKYIDTTWNLASTTPNTIFFDKETQTLYLATARGLNISRDGGATWTPRTTKNGMNSYRVTGVFASGKNVYISTEPYYDPILGQVGGGIAISTNSGGNFVNKTTADGLGANYVRGIHVTGDTIYAATTNMSGGTGGLSISSDKGNSWVNKTMSAGLGSNNIIAVTTGGGKIYAATQEYWNGTASVGGGVCVSADGGQTFVLKTTANGLGSNSVLGLFADGNTLYVATTNGLSISTDGGSTFANKTTVNGLYSNTVHGVYASGAVIYAALAGWPNGGFAISTDGGNTFLNRGPFDGLGGYYVYGVTSDGSNIYAATGPAGSYQGGFSISSDGGSTFSNKTTSNGLGSTSVRKIYANGSEIYAATSGGISISHDRGLTFFNRLRSYSVSGVGVSGSTIYAATGGGVAQSDDNGETFNLSQLGGVGITTINTASGNIIVGTSWYGLYHYQNGIWLNRTTSNGLGGDNIFGIFTSVSKWYAGTNGGLSISTDGGVTWTNRTTANGLGSPGINGIYTSDDVTIYVATGNGPSGGLSISTDGGSSFVNRTTANGLGGNNVYAVYVSGSVVYAATDKGLSVSNDAGASFTNYTANNGLGDNGVSDVLFLP